MGITVRPRGGGRELIPLALAAGYGAYDLKQQEFAEKRLDRRERLEYGGYQAGMDRLARERQLMFQADVQGQRDKAAMLERGKAAGVRREQQLFDQAAANEEWGRRDEVNELQALQGEFTALLKQPWTPEQMQRLQATRKSLRLARESGKNDERQLVDLTRRELNDWSMEQPEGEELPEEFTPEWMLKNVGPSARIGENGSMYFELPNGQKRPFYLKPGAHGLEPVLIDEPDQVDQWGDSKTEAAKRERDEYKVDLKAWKKEVRDLAMEFRSNEFERKKNANAATGNELPEPLATFMNDAEKSVSRWLPKPEEPEYPSTSPQGSPAEPQEPGPFDPGGRLYNPDSAREESARVQAVQERQRWEAENTITPEEAAELPHPTSGAELRWMVQKGEIKPGDRFIGSDGTVKRYEPEPEPQDLLQPWQEDPFIPRPGSES